jgi:hypothetical protein
LIHLVSNRQISEKLATCPDLPLPNATDLLMSGRFSRFSHSFLHVPTITGMLTLGDPNCVKG